jgi:SAM-dependent methyltransferase
VKWKLWKRETAPEEVSQAAKAEPVAAPEGLTVGDYEKLRLIMELVNPQSQPNLNHLGEVVRNIRILSLNIKSLGYELSRQLAAALPIPAETKPRHVGLATSLSTQAAIESDWVAHWCRELRIPVVFHRKVWELAYVLQAMYENGHMRVGARGLGFGSGSEPLSSYLASLGVASTVTDLPISEAEGRGWIETNQHASGLDNAYHPHLVERGQFDRLVDFRPVDMTAIPDDLQGYDFCWSVCALEHLGTIAKGLAFIERSLDTLRPGGLAVHTTEFNVEADGPTIDNWPTVLFQSRHFEALAERLQAKGHKVAPIDFSPGEKMLDRFVDLPPWEHDGNPSLATWLSPAHHLKVAVDGFVCTCAGIVITKAA